jgi:hypothetical protein
MTSNESLVLDYLGRLEAAARNLPADRRAELIEEISAHIAEARAQSASLAGPDADLIDLLARLGDPAEIVRAASDSPALEFAAAASSPDARTAGAARAASIVPPGPALSDGPAAYLPPPPPGAGPGALEITAVILSVGSVVFLVIPGIRVLAPVGWLIGVVLLWYSQRWNTADKVLGTIVWPAGLGLAVLLSALHGTRPHLHAGGPFAVVVLAVLGCSVAAAVIVAVRLLRRAGQHPAFA